MECLSFDQHALGTAIPLIICEQSGMELGKELGEAVTVEWNLAKNMVKQLLFN